MSDIIDIFSKKKIKTEEVKFNEHKIPPPPNTAKEPNYLSRIDKCIEIYMTTGKECTCEYCRDKAILATKLADISRWLVLDHNEKTGRKLQVGDWLEIVVLAKMKVENYIIK